MTMFAVSSMQFDNAAQRRAIQTLGLGELN